MNDKNKQIHMLIKVIKDCIEHKQMGTPNRVWSTYFRYALNELEKDSKLISNSMKENPNQKSKHEHTVPLRLIRDKLMGLEEINIESVSKTLNDLHVVTIISDEEDEKLRAARLGSKMPDDWDGKNPFARYESVGITVFQAFEKS